MNDKLFIKVSAWNKEDDIEIAFDCYSIVDAEKIIDQLKEADVYEVVNISILNGHCPLKDYLQAIIDKEGSL